MLTHGLFRTVAVGLLSAGVVSLVAGPVRADDTPPDSTAGTETDDAEQGATEETADPNADVQVQGKIVVIGPDGQRREYDFGRSFDDEGFNIPGFADRGRLFRFGFGGPVDYDLDGNLDLFAFSHDSGAERFFIGLHCTPADETLRQQLGIDGQGLVVQSVVPDMPAAVAGLQEHDVLLSIGDESLDSVEELMDLVQEAGESPVAVTFLRAGEEQTVEMTPVMTLSPPFNGPQTLKEANVWIRSWVPRPIKYQNLQDPITTYQQQIPKTTYQQVPITTYQQIPNAIYRVEALGPGILFRNHQQIEEGGEETDRFEALEQRVEELTQQIDELRQALDKLE